MRQRAIAAERVQKACTDLAMIYNLWILLRNY
jgi:hypothetical protein